MRILAIDPGPQQSAFVCWDTKTHDFFGPRMGLDFWESWTAAKIDPEVIGLLAIEFPQSYGITAGLSVFSTCFEAGKICQLLNGNHLFTGVTKLFGRPSIKGQIGGRSDSEVNASLRMRFGDAKKGCKLEGVKKDIWAALALAVALDERPSLREVTW